jgi:hypothetical protein
MRKGEVRKLKKEKKRKEQIQRAKLTRAANKKVSTMDKIAGKKHLYIILGMAIISAFFIFYTLRS